jgi:hypothetical protein
MSGTKKKSISINKTNLLKNKNIKTIKNTNQFKYIKYNISKSCSLLNNEQLYILYLYFGINGNLIIGKHNFKDKYNLFYGKQDKKIINNNRSFTLIKKFSNFFYTSNNEYKNISNNNILIFDINDNKNNYMIVSFPVGEPSYYNTTKSLYYHIKSNKTKFNDLIILLSNIKYFIESNKYKKIILIGHSKGMTIATYFAYILLILSVEDDIINTLPKHHNIKEFIYKLKEFIFENNKKEIFLKQKLLENKNNNKIYYKLLKEFNQLHNFNNISNEILNLKSLKDSIQKQIYICGTGGYPILWTKVEEFNIFNNFYLNKYIHIISGDNEKNIQKYDIYAYYNYNFYIYNKIKFELENEKNKIKQQKNIKENKQIKKINYTYFNFGSIVFNLMNNKTVECFKLDNILKDIDINKPLQSTIFEENKNNIILNDYYSNIHGFQYYRYLYKLFMQF